MKQVVRLYAITLLFYVAAQEAREIKVSKIISELGGTPTVYVDLNDGKPVGVTSLFSGTLSYSPQSSMVTIHATMDDEYGKHYKAKKTGDLIGKQIRIGNDNLGGTRIVRVQNSETGRMENKSVRDPKLRIDLVWADAPSRTRIRAYKTTEDKVEWTVLITDQNDNEITRTTFKRNTSNPSLQFNAYEVTKDNDPNIVYNANKIKVFRGKDTSGAPLFEPKIVKWNELDPDKSELEISATGVNFVAKGSEKASKVPDKKIRAYKTVDEKTDWAVVITDNSDSDISYSTFKKNTDGFARSLKLRLNPAEITQGSESQKRYNANKIKVFKSKQKTGTPAFVKTITVSEFNAVPNGELQITADDAKIVAPGGDKK